MKIIKLMGGIGNQMFECAFGLALSKHSQEEVFYDLSWFEKIKTNKGPVASRVYELGVFNINLKFVTEKQMEECINEKKIRTSRLPGFLRKVFKKEKWKIISNKVFETQASVFEPELLKIKGDAYFDGYFQSEKYFLKIRNEILEAFSLREALDEKNRQILDKITNTNSISLHVRRGDYINLQEIHGLCDLQYYKNAINYMAGKIENPHFFLFSDDIDWVKENLKIDYPYTVVDINNEKTAYFDLELMKNCKHNIIANSSFSWWGAWLNQNQAKIVAAPARWFTNVNSNYKDIIPEDWIEF